jgi:hypothetical protein
LRKEKKIAKIRESRDAPTDSEEEVPEEPKATKTKKIHQKPTTITREGHSLDKFFLTVSLIMPQVHILGNQKWADEFAQILFTLREETVFLGSSRQISVIGPMTLSKE